MEGEIPSDLAPLLEAANDFASYPGLQNDAAVKEFVNRFPLPLMFSVLQSKADETGYAIILTSCLERIFKTRYGAGLIWQHMHFLPAGLQSDSQIIRCLACKAVCFLMEVTDDQKSAVHLLSKSGIYPLLIRCLIDGDEQVSASSIDAIVKLASSPEGMSIIFPENERDARYLKIAASQSSSLARIRILALIAKIFAVSSLVASAVYNSGLLNLFENEICNTDDILTALTALELLYELADSPHSTLFLLKTSLLQLLSSLISNSSIDPVLRSRAVLLTGRLLSSPDTYSVVDKNDARTSLLAIDGRLEQLKDQDTDERESALEAVGQIGASIQGAAFVLASPSPVARHVVASAFNRRSRGVNLAALHALGSIAGIDRPESMVILNKDEEEALQHLIYTTAANSSKMTPSGLFLSVLQQEPEIRLAAYRVISALVARPWCLVEVCRKQEIIDIITDAHIETQKNGMDARYNCCMAVSKALSSSNMLNDPAFFGIVEKLQEAVKMGPYLSKKRVEAQPLVVTAERF